MDNNLEIYHILIECEDDILDKIIEDIRNIYGDIYLDKERRSSIVIIYLITNKDDIIVIDSIFKSYLDNKYNIINMEAKINGKTSINASNMY